MSLPLSDFYSLWNVKGAGSPVADEASTRDLTLAGSGTKPRSSSASRRRGAEFRSASFTADSTRFFGTPASGGTLHSSLYVSSKIKTFSFAGYIRPQRSGLTATTLAPVGGIFSATNMGATPRIYDQPCFLFVPQASGASRMVVSVMGSVLDTELATQTSGPTTTTPIAEGAFSHVTVVVVGSTSTNNQVDSVKLYVQSESGVLYTYELGAHRAAATVLFSTSVAPSNNDTFTINGRAYTFKTALTGTPAQGLIENGGGTQPAAGSTLTIGGITYRFVASVSAAQAATAILEINTPNVSTSTKPVVVTVSGYVITLVFSTRSVKNTKAGWLQNAGKDTNSAAGQLFGCFHGDFDNDPGYLQIPAIPTTGYDAGRDWVTGPKRVTTGTATALSSTYSAGSREVPLRSLSEGVGGNSIGVAVDDPNGTWVVRVKAGTTSGGLMIGGVDAAAAYDVKIGATYADTKANLIAAINASGTAGTHYGAGTIANTDVTATDPGGNSIGLTSKKAGSAGNGTTLTQSAATWTLTAIGTTVLGVDGATADHVLIGASAATAWQNFADAINRTGQRGTQYGDPTTINADVTATYSSGVLFLAGLASGASGNSVTLSASIAAGAAVTIRDEFRDKTATTLVGGAGAPPLSVASGARPDQTDLRALWGGWGQTPNATGSIFPGMVSDFAISNRELSAVDVVSLASTPPPTSVRDVGWYRGNSAAISASVKTERMSSWPKPRSIGDGLSGRIPAGPSGVRAAFRVFGVNAGAPWQLTRARLGTVGRGGIDPQGAPKGLIPYDGFEYGVSKSASKSTLSTAEFADVLNMSFQGGAPRRRRGYRIITGDGSTEEAPSAIFDATNASGDTYQLFKSGTKLYIVDNGDPIELDDGYASNALPTVATVGNKTFVVSPARTKVVIQGTVLDVGVEAPTQTPAFSSSTPNITNGVIALTPGFEYCYTYYDGTKLTESGPSPSILVVLPAGTPASSITLGSIAVGGSSITKRMIYRRKKGTETWFFVGSIDNNTGTEFTDLYELPLTTRILESYAGYNVTASFPAATACASFEDRLLLWGDPSDRRVVYISEVGDGERHYFWNRLTCRGEVRAVLEHEGRLVIYTDRSVEVVDGDWIRGTGGFLGISKKVVDNSKGISGPYAVCSAGGRAFWADSSGIHTLNRGLDARDTSRAVSWRVHPVVQDAVDTAGTSVVMAHNYVSNQLWVCLTRAQPDATSTKNRVVLVLDLDALEAGRVVWSIYDRPLSWVSKLQDGLLGTMFVGCDYLGNMLELDVYDGDGIQGNESWFPGVSVVASAVNATTKVLTFVGTSLPSTGIRGVGVVLEDSVTGAFFTSTAISAPSSTTLKLTDVPSWLAVGTIVHIGGILGMEETGEIDLGSQDEKRWGPLEIGLADASSGRF